MKRFQTVCKQSFSFSFIDNVICNVLAFMVLLTTTNDFISESTCNVYVCLFQLALLFIQFIKLSSQVAHI